MHAYIVIRRGRWYKHGPTIMQTSDNCNFGQKDVTGMRHVHIVVIIGPTVKGMRYGLKAVSHAM
jgi:hypothetical protein